MRTRGDADLVSSIGRDMIHRMWRGLWRARNSSNWGSGWGRDNTQAGCGSESSSAGLAMMSRQQNKVGLHLCVRSDRVRLGLNICERDPNVRRLYRTATGWPQIVGTADN